MSNGPSTRRKKTTLDNPLRCEFERLARMYPEEVVVALIKNPPALFRVLDRMLVKNR